MKILPGPSEVVREALIVVGGALLAAFIIGRMPELKAWVKEQWR